MLSLSHTCRYYLYRLPADMRKGADSLCGLVRNEMKRDPLTGAIFIFISRNGDKIKLLHWEGDGYALYSKRLEEGSFQLPVIHTTAPDISLTSDELHMLLRGIVLHSIMKHKRYRRIVDKSVE